MRLCLTCYRVWPREAILCGHCGRSFGGRRCPRRHLSPAAARCCVQCGATPLTEPTASVPLAWLPLGLAWGSALLVVIGLWHAVQRPLLAALARDLERLAAWTIVIGLVLMLLPGDLGRWARCATSRLFSGLGRLLVCGLAYRLLRDGLRLLALGLAAGRGPRRS